MIGFIFGFLVGGAFAFQLGFYFKELLQRVRSLQLPDIKPTVTRGSDHPVNENWPSREESHIVEPKTPQQVEWEAQEELRKQNLG